MLVEITKINKQLLELIDLLDETIYNLGNKIF